MTTTSTSVRKHIPKLVNIAFCSAYLSSDQASLGANSWDKINLNTTVYDVGSNFDTTNHKFVAPVTGLYKIKGIVHFTAITATKLYQSAIYQNGSAVAYAKQHSSTTDDISVTVETEIFLTQNDYVELYANPNPSGCSAKSGIGYTRLEIRLVTKEGIKQ